MKEEFKKLHKRIDKLEVVIRSELRKLHRRSYKRTVSTLDKLRSDVTKRITEQWTERHMPMDLRDVSRLYSKRLKILDTTPEELVSGTKSFVCVTKLSGAKTFVPFEAYGKMNFTEINKLKRFGLDEKMIKHYENNKPVTESHSPEEQREIKLATDALKVTLDKQVESGDLILTKPDSDPLDDLDNMFGDKTTGDKD